jgi:SagB-type dehydrogenase family enzyme
MLNRETHICRSYAQAAFRRAIEPLEPPDFVPNWHDHPSLYKIYANTERLALPLERPRELLSLEQLFTRIASPQAQISRPEGLPLEELATMLYFAHGVLSRRLKIHPDQKAHMVARYYSTDLYARGTASGGGLYPTEIYWICGEGNAVAPGIYHYDNAHHALEHLFTGDATSIVQAAAFAHPAACNTNQFLLITLNFWKNTFKYNNFGYHVMTQDIGALLCSLWFLAVGYQIDWHPLFWYQDEQLNKLLGLCTDIESVLALVPLPASNETPFRSAASRVPGKAPITSPTFQRSTAFRTFAMGKAAHSSTLLTDDPLPTTTAIAWANVRAEEAEGCEHISLPPPMLADLQKDLLDTFQMRRSSFGTFSASPPLSQAELATLLYTGALLRNYRSDIKSAASLPHFTRQAVFINHVAGIKRGTYNYNPSEHCLTVIEEADMALFLQQHYFLQNYSLAEAAAVIAIIGNLETMLEVYGNRGYRLLNAEAGLVAQGLYMVSTALSLACGAALGFDNTALNSVLGLDQTGQQTLLFVLVGHELSQTGDFDYRLV